MDAEQRLLGVTSTQEEKDPGAQSQESFLEDSASAVFAQLVRLPRRGLSETCAWSAGLGPSGLFRLLVLLCILHGDKSQPWGWQCENVRSPVRPLENL